MPIEEKAHARNSDPETSHAAALSVDGLREKQRAVLNCFETGEKHTDEALIVIYESRRQSHQLPLQTESGIRTRRSELVKKGFLIDSGERGKTATGRSAIMWRKSIHCP